MEERLAKKWFIKCISTLIFVLVFVALTVFIVDPYFHYHKPLSFLSYRLNEERYINDGISRHFDFDALITGTSMAQNFKPSEMDAMFGTNSVKEPFSGAGYQELSENLERNLKRNPELKTVLWVVDYNGFLRDYDWVQYESYPTYLYDDNPFNDVSYLYNKAILYHGVFANIGMTLTGASGTTMDEYSAWERDCGLAIVMQSYKRELLDKNADTGFGRKERDAVVKTIDTNIVQLVNRYPDVTFYIVYPPYSICYFDALNIMGTLSRQLQAEQTATELLLECPNVKLYNFFDQTDIICNLDNYCDDGHYNARVNSLILKWISEGTGLVTKENYLEKLEAEKEFFGNYDYESIYAGAFTDGGE